MSRAIDSENLYKFLTDQRVNETGAFAKGVNKGINIARSALRNEQIAPTITPPNEWVSVEDRLPTPGERVIATDGQFVGEGYLDSCCRWFRYGGFEWRFFDIERDVTHWMPLPEPPDSRPPEGEEDTE